MAGSSIVRNVSWARCRRIGIALVLAVLFTSALWIGNSGAAENLQCYKIKDSQSLEKYGVDLDAFTPEPGCTIMAKAKYLCLAGSQENFDPSPPNPSASTFPAGSFLCYKTKCPKDGLLDPNNDDEPFEIPVSDRFGVRDVTLKKTKLACLPVGGSTGATRCCNLVMSGLPLGCFDFVEGVNAYGELLCVATGPSGTMGPSGATGPAVAPAGQVCNGGSGGCTEPPASGTGVCCEVGSSGVSFCFEGLAAFLGPSPGLDTCASMSGTLTDPGRCGVDGHCTAP